jgi:hypothetical protein
VPQRPIKLAGLLRDMAEQPGRSRVSLNVLQDAHAAPHKPFWQRHWAKILIGCLAIVIAGNFVAFSPKLQKTTSTQQDITKAGQGTTLPGDSAAFSKPVQELMAYVACLQKGECSFSDQISGEAAAKRFEYTRLFASAYEEVILRVKNRDPERTSLRAGVIAAFEAIAAEEQSIDRLMAKKESHAATIAYLRALQNGDVIFPGPQAAAPAPPVLLAQLMTAYPNAAFDIDDVVFALVYRDAREFAARQVSQSGEVSVYEIIGEFRRLIVQSAARRAEAVPSQCEQGMTLGYADVLTKACANLRLTARARQASEAMAAERAVLQCKTAASTTLSAELDSMQQDDVVALCARMEQRTRQGEVGFLEIVR